MTWFSQPARAWPLWLCLGLFGLGCSDSTTGPTVIPGPGLPQRTLLLGGDISALARVELGGSTFRDGDSISGAIAALRAHGSNTFRLRLFVQPNGEEVQVNDLAYTIALAQRIRASGATLLLDFHYSDTWADPAHQTTPAAWSALDIDALEDTVEAYTARVLDSMRAAGALPRMVQIGNEIDGGLLWPLGRIGAAGFNDAAAFTRFGRLLKAGVRGVRSATTAADSVRVLIHYSQSGSASGTQWFFDAVQAQGVEYDVIGLSYYPWWHGALSSLRTTLQMIGTRYTKDVMIVEVAYPWKTGWDPGGSNAAAMVWPLTTTGQRAFLLDVIATLRETPGQRGLGVIWWYPEAVLTPGLFVWGGGTLGLFDATGQILPAAHAFTLANLRP